MSRNASNTSRVVAHSARGVERDRAHAARVVLERRLN
jgi:hypothetical protein